MYRPNEFAEPTPVPAVVGAPAAGIVRRVYGAVARLLRALANRRAVSIMLKLDDRLLADIGISRSDVACALAQPLWVDPSRELVETVEGRRRVRLCGRPLRRG